MTSDILKNNFSKSTKKYFPSTPSHCTNEHTPTTTIQSPSHPPLSTVVKSRHAFECEFCVAAGCHDGFVYNLDVVNGICIWKVDLQAGSVFASIHHSYSGELVACTLGGDVCGIDSYNGNILWRVKLHTAIFASPTSTSFAIIVATVDKHILALHKYTHSILWKYETEAPIFSSPIICRYPVHGQNKNLRNKNNNNKNNNNKIKHNGVMELVIFGCHDSSLRCLAAENGQLLWKTLLSSSIYSTPFLFKCSTQIGQESQHVISKQPIKHFDISVDNAAVCSTDGCLYVIELVSGAVMASHQLPGDVFSSVVCVDGCLVVGCRDDYVYCFHLLGS